MTLEQEGLAAPYTYTGCRTRRVRRFSRIARGLLFAKLGRGGGLCGGSLVVARKMAGLVFAAVIAGLLSAATAQFCLDGKDPGACYIAQLASQTDCTTLSQAWAGVTQKASRASISSDELAMLLSKSGCWSSLPLKGQGTPLLVVTGTPGTLLTLLCTGSGVRVDPATGHEHL